MTQPPQAYGITVELALPYEQAMEKAVAALKTEGFGVLTEIDVKATLQQKIKVDFRKYTILGACNPVLAHRALSAELDIGLLLPCNVIVYENVDAPGSVVSIVDSLAMLTVSSNPTLQEVAMEARQRLQRVVAALAT